MFNLEKQIAAWREQMLNAGIKNPAVLDELEAHLREDMERQVRSGLNSPQAFETATGRIGPGTALKTEFAKAGFKRQFRGQRFMQLFCIILPILYFIWMSPFLLHVEMSPLQRSLTFTAMALTILCMLGWPYTHRYLPVIADRRARTAIQVGCAFSIPIFGPLLPNLNLNFVPLGLTLLWAIAAYVVFLGVAIGIGTAARKAARTAGS